MMMLILSRVFGLLCDNLLFQNREALKTLILKTFLLLTYLLHFTGNVCETPKNPLVGQTKTNNTSPEPRVCLLVAKAEQAKIFPSFKHTTKNRF